MWTSGRPIRKLARNGDPGSVGKPPLRSTIKPRASTQGQACRPRPRQNRLNWVLSALPSGPNSFGRFMKPVRKSAAAREASKSPACAAIIIVSSCPTPSRSEATQQTSRSVHASDLRPRTSMTNLHKHLSLPDHGVTAALHTLPVGSLINSIRSLCTSHPANGTKVPIMHRHTQNTGRRQIPLNKNYETNVRPNGANHQWVRVPLQGGVGTPG